MGNFFMSKIKCRLCNNEYDAKRIGAHVSRTHKMDYVEYATLYWMDLPNWSPCKNKECGTICKATYCSAECFSIGQSITLMGRKQPTRSEAHSRKISEAAKKRLSDPTQHPMYGKKHSDESLRLISNTQKKRLSDPTQHPMYGKTHSTNSKELMSKSHKGKRVGERNGMYGKTHTPEAIKKIFSKRTMNKLETLVSEWLDTHGIKYHYQFFINKDGICKSYDFKIKGTNKILEIHGDYWHGGEGVDVHFFDVDSTIKNDKIKKELAESLGYEVIVVWEHELKDNVHILSEYL
jgi:G:T-mismatch repair DNA endonuclease (very short patch repair protein)